MTRTFLPHVITDDSALGGAEIERSFRFNDNDSAYLQRQPSSNTSGSSQKITISFWIKLGNIPSGTNGGTFFGTSGDNHRGQFFNQEFYFGNANYWINTTALVRDPSSWYHVVYVVDTTQGTTSNRQKIYVNGVLQDRGDTISDPSQNATFDYFNNSSQTYYIGRRQSGNYFDGYLAEIHFIDGYAYDASYFGYTEQQTGIWRHKKVTGITYGTNGFYLDFSDNSSITNICLDKSGNANNFSPDNCNTEDSMLDTPTNNFATMTPIHGYGGLSQGNLRFNIYNDSSGPRSTQATIALPKSGKWYWEARYQESGTGTVTTKYFGVSQLQNTNGYLTAPYVYYDRTHIKNGNNSEDITHGQDWYNGVGVPAILGCAINVDNNTVSFYHNNTLQGTITLPTITSSQEYFFTWANTSGGSSSSLNDTFNFGADSTFQGQVSRGNNTDANGIGDFKYAPPSGHLALCSKNLPPKNVPSIIRPKRHFDVLTWTGNGSTGQNITGLEFKPDLLWIKKRNESESWGGYDSVRGVNKRLYINGTNVEETITTLSAFFHGGFRVEGSGGGPTNDNGDTYVGFCWKAGGATTVANTDGDQTTQVSVNEEAGLSIVTYTGTGSNTNIGHGLGGTPDVVITKSRSATGDWAFLDRIGNSTAEYGLFLNDNGGYSSYQGGTYWNDTLPTSTVFRVSSNDSTNASGVTYVAYCWRSIPGYSKIGTYEATNNTDGPFVDLGFQPKWVMMKPVDSGGNWQIYDTSRTPVNKDNGNAVYPDLTNAEASGFTMFDFLSTGFKNRNSGSGGINYSGTYIYMAFAEQSGTTPFDTFPNAR